MKSSLVLEYVGITPESLSDDQRDKLRAFIESHPPDAIQAIVVYPNFDAHSEHDVPSGMIVKYNPEARVDPTTLPKNLFQRMHVSRVVRGGSGEDSYFEKRIPEIQQTVDQFTATPISGKTRGVKRNSDTSHWSPELGGSGSFVGVYSQLKENMRDKEHFVVARGTAPLYVEDLKRQVAAEKPTYGQLVTDNEWIKRIDYGDRAAKRNVNRNIANVAEACGVEVVRDDDRFSHNTNLNFGEPEVAAPEWEQISYSIDATTHNGAPSVAFLHGVVPSEECLRMENGRFFVCSNPYDGIFAFPLTNYERLLSVDGIPADTGRAKPISSLVGVAVDKERLRGVTWDGASKDAANVDLHPEAFRPVGAQFKDAMKEMGWNAEDHVLRMVPIACKIYNENLVRAQ